VKTYGQYITLNKNARGCYMLDTIKGCQAGLENNNGGCYGECYATRAAKRFSYDFSKSIKRKAREGGGCQLYLPGFKNPKHLNRIIRQIYNINMPFVRIGDMGDPSEDWEHTIDICKKISPANKPIVIVTKHWNDIPDYLLRDIERLGLYINTSISALDSNEQILHRLYEYYRLKDVCNSVLRIVSCDFNKQNTEGVRLSKIQDELFKQGKIIDTVFRVRLNNPLVTEGIINIKKTRFLSSFCYASVYNRDTYFGNCKQCPDMCGTTMGNDYGLQDN